MTAWSPPKVLYFLTRYYSLIALIILQAHRMTCRQWIVFEGVSALILELSVEIMLILRLYALYTGNKPIARLMVILFATEGIVMLTMLGISIPRIMTSAGCVEADIPVELVAYSITSILFETFLFTLTIRRYLQARKAGWGNIDLLAVLFRDGAWAFAVIFAVMVINTVLFALGPRTLAALGFPWLLAILGVVGPRLMLNVREINQRHAPPSSPGDMDTGFTIYDPLNIDDPDMEPDDSEKHS